MKIKEILHISRPRFWLYEAATFGIVGTLGANNGLGFFSDPRYFIFFLYFLIPANILIYGINDIYDYETDKLNPKKGTYEAFVPKEKHRSLLFWVFISNLPFLFFLPKETPFVISFFVFLFCATFYSAPPIRAKAKPIIDSVFSAGHYVATGVCGYYLAGGESFPTLGVIAGMLWAIAMHAYSAIPDIMADTKAGLRTIAILIGKSPAIYFCWALYLISAYLVSDTLPIASSIGAILFSYFMYRSTKTQTEESLLAIYKYFPKINTFAGMIVSLELLFRFFM